MWVYVINLLYVLKEEGSIGRAVGKHYSRNRTWLKNIQQKVWAKVRISKSRLLKETGAFLRWWLRLLRLFSKGRSMAPIPSESALVASLQAGLFHWKTFPTGANTHPEKDLLEWFAEDAIATSRLRSAVSPATIFLFVQYLDKGTLGRCADNQNGNLALWNIYCGEVQTNDGRIRPLFLDALASLDLKLSVSESVSH